MLWKYVFKYYKNTCQKCYCYLNTENCCLKSLPNSPWVFYHFTFLSSQPNTNERKLYLFNFSTFLSTIYFLFFHFFTPPTKPIDHKREYWRNNFWMIRHPKGGHINMCMVEIKLGYDLLFNFTFGYKFWRLCPSKIKRRATLKFSHKNLETPTNQQGSSWDALETAIEAVANQLLQSQGVMVLPRFCYSWLWS